MTKFIIAAMIAIGFNAFANEHEATEESAPAATEEMAGDHTADQGMEKTDAKKKMAKTKSAKAMKAKKDKKGEAH